MKQISPQDEEIIRQWSDIQTSPTFLNVVGGEGLAGEMLVQFCDEFKVLAPVVQIRKEQEEPFAAPAIIIGRHKNIAYQALPEGKELLPFLEALSAAANPGTLPKYDFGFSTRIELPAHLAAFIAQQCPYCPQVVTQVLCLAEENPLLRLTIIDGVLFGNLAEERGIRSVPTLILDNEIRWTGQINIEEVVRQCVRRDPAQLSTDTLRQIIENSDAARVASMMCSSNRIFPAFIDLLVHERWSVRLGAMVTVEYLAEESPDLAAQLFAPLQKRFTDLDASVQGDLVQVLAQLKNKEIKEYLQTIVCSDCAESVREAATEELETLKKIGEL
ncbi:MAG: thioredoxin family protein [Proteobacteria bacterium]|nr:thioredoxin family protein [Pseudomonadota bacterium]